jgi:transposase InsO family protein
MHGGWAHPGQELRGLPVLDQLNGDFLQIVSIPFSEAAFQPSDGLLPRPGTVAFCPKGIGELDEFAEGALAAALEPMERGEIMGDVSRHLLRPQPRIGRRVPWSVFLKAHWKAIATSDFFTVEVWSWRGLVTHHILYVIDLATRHVVIAGITTNPNDAWMLQMARNLTDAETGMLRGTRHLIVDRNTKYSKAFGTFLAREGVEVIRLPPRSPNPNAYAERFVGSVKSECLSRLIPIDVPMLRRVMHEYMEHYHRERNHQGLANELIVPLRVLPSKSEPVGRRTRLGGMLSYYERAAA